MVSAQLTAASEYVHGQMHGRTCGWMDGWVEGGRGECWTRGGGGGGLTTGGGGGYLDARVDGEMPEYFHHLQDEQLTHLQDPTEPCF